MLIAVLLLSDRLELLLPMLAVFVALEALVLWKVWPARQRARLSEAARHGQLALQAEKERTDRIRSDLIATVSHEFRTPLTGIRGAALTLLKRGDRLEPSARNHLLRCLLDQEERLSRLLENMLVAAEATSADPEAAAEVDAVIAEVIMLAGARRPECPPAAVAVEPDTVARIGRQALHQVLANLVDNAQQHGHPRAVPLVAAGRDGLGVWITVSNEGTTLDSRTARMLFEPFTQADSGTTREREGLGLGLYVVRRLVEVHRGSILLRSEEGWTTVEVRLADGGSSPRSVTRKAISPEPSAVPRTLPREALVR
jgi:signal transduction histidine kinase